MHSGLFDESLGFEHLSEHVRCVGTPNAVLIAIDSTHFHLDCDTYSFGLRNNILAAMYAVFNVMEGCVDHNRVKWELKSHFDVFGLRAVIKMDGNWDFGSVC